MQEDKLDIFLETKDSLLIFEREKVTLIFPNCVIGAFWRTLTDYISFFRTIWAREALLNE